MTTDSHTQALPTANGYYPLAPGKLAALTLYYERLAPFDPKPHLWPEGVSCFRLGPDNLEQYRTLFRSIGERWLWVSRLEITDSELAAVLADPDTEAFALEKDGAMIGLLELDCHEKGEAEIVYVGLVEQATGSGLGGAMMTYAFARATARAANRVWLHTCHFDSSQASRFYEKCGFKAYQLAVEIMDDPRISGQLRPEAAPHVPFVPLARK